MPVWPDEVQAFLRKALEPNGDAKLMTVAGCRSVVDSTYAAREGFTESTPLEEINEHLDCLVDYRNGFERHRELLDMPLNVWTNKIKSGHCKLRQPPQDGWWELIWSEWKGSMIGPRGRLLVDGFLCTTQCANGTRVWICRHIDGTVSLVLNKPEKGVSPKVVFTNNPKVYRSR